MNRNMGTSLSSLLVSIIIETSNNLRYNSKYIREIRNLCKYNFVLCLNRSVLLFTPYLQQFNPK